MIRRYLTLLFLCMPLLFAGELTTKANLESVKVFLGGAEISHSAQVNIPAGINDIAIGNVAYNIVNNSLQVGGKGDFIILSVSTRVNFLEATEKTNEVKALEDSLELLREKRTDEENRKSVTNLQLELLKSNLNLGGNAGNVTIQELQNMSDYIGKKAALLMDSITASEKAIVKINKRIDEISSQIDEITQKYKSPSTEIVATVQAQRSTNAKLDISYITYDAGWNPSYDIRATDILSPLELNLRANMWQSTGLEWKDVDITLSTRSARVSNNKPVLHKWYVNYIQEMEKQYSANKRLPGIIAQEIVAVADEAAGSMADYMEVNETQLAVEYTPSINYTIPSDGKSHIVSLQDYEIPAEYEYYAAPKLDNNAFLVAYVKDWGEYNLLPGSANIYYNNSFVGISFVNPVTTEDRMAFSLGRDKSIYINRETQKDFMEDKFFGSDVERFFGYEITVKNNKSKDIKITIEDQVPVSQNEDIEVKIQETSDAKLDKETGILTWQMELAPGETAKRKFAFSVRYPGNKPIDIY